MIFREKIKDLKRKDKELIYFNLVVKIEKSGNRYSGWDDGNKHTSEISISIFKRNFTKKV